MKIYESKLAQLSGHIFWAFCLYTIIAIILGILFKLMVHAEDGTLSTFCGVIAVWLGHVYRFRKMYYKINDDTLVQYDFQSRTIFIDQIVSVCVLERMKWISFHTPYNIVIETIDKEKYYMAPKDAESMAEILIKENPEIKVIQK